MQASGSLDRFRLDGRTAFVCGGARGIGFAIATLLAEAGATVHIGDVLDEIGKESAERIDGHFVHADVTSTASVDAAVESVLATSGGLDVAVNCAGIRHLGGAAELVTDEEWDGVINLNLNGVFRACRAEGRAMLAAGRGAIVNIASMAGRRGLAYRVGYCSAKAGQIGMTYGLALELGRHNITVNAIAPCAVAGDRIDRVIKGQADVRGIDVDRVRQSFVERSPLRRMSTAEDIASLAVFLCSDLARNISGQCVPVTAGEPAG
jgi:NAD(P)-dependent dehydrogenase (short-subunit alcohol dehydrogenase family)